MALGVRPISVASAGQILAGAMNMDWSTDRDEVVRYLNKYRELLYTEYPRQKLFTDVFHCIRITTFNRCGGIPPYKGFTIPADVAGVEAIYRNGHPLGLHSRWREVHDGPGSRMPRLQAQLLPELYPTERDMDRASSIGFFCDNENDTGKKVVVKVRDTYGEDRKITFSLKYNTTVRSRFSVLKVLSVVLPTDLCGGLILTQSGGRVLSEYPPGSTDVPTFQRVKVDAARCPDSVVLHGNRQFIPVYFDHDVLECGNTLALEAAGRFFKHESSSDASEIKSAEYQKAMCLQYVRGEVARHDGRATQDGNTFAGESVTAPTTLPGY